jgi:hypothetical protein
VILFRAVGLHELHLISGSGFRAFPPRRPDQPFFYPVLERAYAQQIASDWNTRDERSGFAGFVAQFEVPDAIASQYPVQTVGAREHRELWVPAGALLEFNLRIVGRIQVIDAYTGPGFKGTIDSMSKLPLPPRPGGELQVVYRLQDDAEHIAAVQRATLETEDYGIEPTHGLFGSIEWWQNIETGRLALQTLKGTISRIYMASMNDWPEFEVRSDAGGLSQWTRVSNYPDLERAYVPGREVEIDYVVQRHRPKSSDGGSETQVVVAIRVAAEPGIEPRGRASGRGLTP